MYKVLITTISLIQTRKIALSSESVDFSFGSSQKPPFWWICVVFFCNAFVYRSMTNVNTGGKSETRSVIVAFVFWRQSSQWISTCVSVGLWYLLMSSIEVIGINAHRSSIVFLYGHRLHDTLFSFFHVGLFWEPRWRGTFWPWCVRKHINDARFCSKSISRFGHAVLECKPFVFCNRKFFSNCSHLAM